VLAALVLALISPWGHLADPVFIRVDTHQLPNPVVEAIAQDSTGLMWVGTAGGLAAFDGYQFRRFGGPNVVTMVSDPHGGLWLGTASSGLMHFDPATEQFAAWKPDARGLRGPRSTSIWAFAQVDRELWIGGDSGLDLFDLRAGTFAHISVTQGVTQPEVRSLLVDRKHRLWIGTDRGLFYRAPNGTIAPFALAGAPIWSLYEDANGRLWAGSFDSVFVFGRDRRLALTFRSTSGGASIAPGLERAITEAQRGIIWIGSSQGGVSVVDVGARSVQRVAGNQSGAGELGADVVWQWFRDRAGSIWVAGYNGGLFIHDPLARGVYTLPSDSLQSGLADTQARAVAAAPNDRLWVGGLDGSLIELDSRTGRIATLHVPKASTTLAPAVDGSLWIGMQHGLCRLRGAQLLECPAGPSAVGASWVMAVLDTSETLWVGTQTGLIAQNKRSGSVVVYQHGAAANGLANSFVTALLRDRDGRLWVGTVNGLSQIDTRTGEVVPIRLARGSSIASGFIESIAQDQRGRIWVGAYGIPSMVLENAPAGTFTIRRIGIAEGLPESVDALAIDPSGRVWASMDNPGDGIATIDPYSLGVRELSPSDGVSLEQYAVGAAARATNGTLFFGGLKGVTVIAPGAAPAPASVAPLIVTGLEIGRKPVPAWNVNRADAHVELPADARDISVEFAALDYTAAQSLRYAYRLEGFDRDWISADAAHRIATYTNLPPGNYTLQVRATNRFGAWSERMLRLNVRALPAWYEKSWFRILLGLLFIVFLLALHFGRTALLRRRQRELEDIVQDRTCKLQEANVMLEEMTLTDPLTGLRNRRFVTQHLEADVAAILRQYEDASTDEALLFFLVDIDNFKAVNDKFGHRAGDLVLVQMRERLHEVFRESDIVARWGGEEFLAVARNSRRSDAPEIAERLRRAVSSRAFTLDGGETIVKTASVGVAAFPFVVSAPRAVSWPQVVELADQALYIAKNGGRDRWVGLSAIDQTDPERLAKRLTTSAEEAVRLGEVKIIP
jgi:diguanylate cyclase (GGDEF)-like protein